MSNFRSALESCGESSCNSSSDSSVSSDGWSASSCLTSTEASENDLSKDAMNITSAIGGAAGADGECTIKNVDGTEYYAMLTQEWTKRVPIGMGLCPWAGKSLRSDRLRFVTCLEVDPSQVETALLGEAVLLMEKQSDNDGNNKSHAFFTTLLICPNVAEWNSNFSAFDNFVKKMSSCIPTDKHATHDQDESNGRGDPNSFLHQQITLVAFHPQFLRWRGLPEGIDSGSTIHAHKNVGGLFQKSRELFPATILETSSRVFGRRRIRVQFHPHTEAAQGDSEVNKVAEGTSRDIQYIPVDWCVLDAESTTADFFNVGDQEQPQPLRSLLGPPLPDNIMHQSPFPTIHLIRSHDLAKLKARDASRVKRKNAQRMTHVELLAKDFDRVGEC